MKAKWFVKGDWDGFIGLFIDNLLQLLLIATLCPLVCGIPLATVAGLILPGAAVSVVAGNLFYSWQAWRLAKRTGRNDVTALPTTGSSSTTNTLRNALMLFLLKNRTNEK